jgi:drug/metabolite transporter (DMT)-like permease
MSSDRSAHTFPPHLVGLLMGLTLGWGFNWPMMKIALAEMEPMHFRTLCLLFGAAGLLTIARMNGLPVRVPRGQRMRMVAIALVNIAGWNIFAIYGVRLMASGRAAILGYTMPVWSVLLSTWLLNEPFTKRRALGTALGCAGLLLLLGEEVHAVARSPLGALLMVGAAVSWALGTVMMKRWPVSLPTSSFTGWQMLGVLYNLLVAFLFCYWAWTKIALVAPVGVASLSVMMIPVVGVFSGMLVLGESPSWQDYAALLLVVGALATVLLPAKESKTSRPAR